MILIFLVDFIRTTEVVGARPNICTVVPNLPIITDTGADLMVYLGVFNISFGKMLWELETKSRFPYFLATFVISIFALGVLLKSFWFSVGTKAPSS